MAMNGRRRAIINAGADGLMNENSYCLKCGVNFSFGDNRAKLLPIKWQLHKDYCEIYQEGLKNELKFLKRWGRK